MTGAMYAAIAGLKTHMNKMNVIGNNIANVNTAGYKSQRAIFKDAMYTTYSGGSDGTSTMGGKNPSQIGYGSQLSTIDLNMGTGTYTPGRSTDCMIYGDGFFLVGDKDTANNIKKDDTNSVKYLRMNSIGDFEFKGDGYLCDGNGNVVYGFLTTGVDPVTGKPQVSDQLVPIRLPKFDNGGIKYPSQTGPNGKLEDYKGAGGAIPDAQMDGITINPTTGAITATSKDTKEVITIGYLAIGNVTNPNGVTHEDGFYYKAGDGAGDLQISMMGGVAKDLNITQINGSITGGGAASPKLKIGSAGGTKLMCGGLEGSNVDLASEISEMITTQRGYQANTRIITVTDAMLEELVNVKR